MARTGKRDRFSLIFFFGAFRWFFIAGCSSQGRLPGAPQGDTSTLRHEEDQQAKPDPEEPDPAGVRGEGHPHLRREPLRGLHVLLLRNTPAPVHGHGVRGR